MTVVIEEHSVGFDWRAVRCDGERGSVTPLVIFVVLPVLFLGLTLSIDLGNFLSVREEIRGLVDREALAALRGGIPPKQLEDRMSQQLRVFEPMVKVDGIQVSSVQGKLRVDVDAEYHSYFAQLLQTLAGRDSGWKISLASSAAVRKISSSTLLVLDRVVVPRVVGCNDPTLLRSEQFIEGLGQGLQRSGAANVAMAAFPSGIPRAEDEPPTHLAPIASESSADLLPDCGSEYWRVVGGMTAPPPPNELVAELEVMLGALIAARHSDRNAVVMVLRGKSAEMQFISTFIQEFAAVIERLRTPVSLIVIRVDPTDENGTGLQLLGEQLGVNYREVTVTSESVNTKELRTAVIGEIAERIVVAE